MYKLAVIISSFAILMAVSCSDADKDKDKEEYFERSLVDAFKLKDFNKFQKLIITPDDMTAGLSSDSSNANTSPNNKDLVESYKKTYLNQYKRIFDRIITQGEQLGITWKNVKFNNFLYMIKEAMPRSGFHVLNGHINISGDDKNYFIYGIEAQKYKTGFKIHNIKSIKSGRLEAYVDSNTIQEPN